MTARHAHRRWPARGGRTLTLACALALALSPEPGSAAGLRVTARGPRSATIAARLREALLQAGVRAATVMVSTRRSRPRWHVSIRILRPDSADVVAAQAIAARGGEVPGSALAQVAKRAAAALSAPGEKKPPEKKPPEKPPDTPPAEVAPGEPEEPQPAPPKPPPAKPAPPPAKPAPPAKPQDEDLGFDGPSTAPKAKPPASSAAADDLGFNVAEDKRPAARPPVVVRRDEPPPNRLVVRAGVGVGLAMRHFLLDVPGAFTDYETGVYSQLSVEGELYPLQLVTANPIALLGVRLAYAHSAGLNTEIEQSGTPASSYATSIQRIWGGLIYTLPRFRPRYAPRLWVRTGIAHFGFEVTDNAKVGGLSLTTYAAGGGFALPLWRYIMPEASCEYRILLRGRSSVFDPYRVDPAALQGFTLDAAIRGTVIGGLGYKLSFTYERFRGELAALASADALAVRDQYLAGELALTYEL